MDFWRVNVDICGAIGLESHGDSELGRATFLVISDHIGKMDTVLDSEGLGCFHQISLSSHQPCILQFSSVQFSHSVTSDSLKPHESQHASPPCPSTTPGVHSDHVHLVNDAIQPSYPLLSPSPPAPNPSQHQGLFQ